MNWIAVVGAVLVVALLAGLAIPARKGRKPAADGRMSAEEMSEVMRDLWDRTEQALRSHKDARGDAVAPARERLLGMADEADAMVERPDVQRMSERQIAMWRITAEEIRAFVNEGLAQHPEGRRS